MKLCFGILFMLSFLWASFCQMIRIIANITFANIVVSNLSGCWWFYITFGFMILFLAWCFAQVRMLVMRRRRIAILVTTFVVCMGFMRSSLFTRGSPAMFAKRNFSFIFLSLNFPRDFVLKSEASVRFRFCQNDPFYFSSYQKKTIIVSQICLTCFVSLSDLRKTVLQDQVVVCAG